MFFVSRKAILYYVSSELEIEIYTASAKHSCGRPHTNLNLGWIQSKEHLTQHIIQSSSAAKASSKQHRFLFLHCLLGSIADNHPRTNFDVLPSLDMITRRSTIFPWKSENTLTIKKELHHSEQ